MSENLKLNEHFQLESDCAYIRNPNTFCQSQSTTAYLIQMDNRSK